MWKVILGIVAGLIAVIVVSMALVLTYDAMDKRNFSHRSPLAANLPTHYQKANTIFQKRIEKRFPVGSDAGELVKVLSKQDFRQDSEYPDNAWFKPDTFTSQFDKEANILALTPGPGINFPCRLVWIVMWTANHNNQITAIYAEYHGVCV